MDTLGPAPRLYLRRLYDQFDVPLTDFDCGLKCAPHNPHGVPFCCDICHAVPVAFHQEWEYLQTNTDLWHAWRGDECADEPCEPANLLDQIPPHMTALACQGPARCQRPFRLVSCRQFPFFPYITSDDRFIGLAYEWDFEDICWVISNLGTATAAYRNGFVNIYDQLLAMWEDEFESYANLSDDMRQRFAARKQRIPLLHRNGGYYLISPDSERLRRASPERFRRFGPYRQP